MLNFTVNDWLYCRKMGCKLSYEEYIALYNEQRCAVEVVVAAWCGYFARKAQGRQK